MSDIHKIAVLGAGSWGTALALLLARNGHDTRLWARNPEQARDMQRDRCNKRYLPGHPFPNNLTIFADLAECIASVETWLVVVPSIGFTELITRLKPHVTENHKIAWGTKGVDANHRLLHEVVQTILARTLPMAVLSGPSLAKEVASGLPTAVSLASNDITFAKHLIYLLHAPHFRVYHNHDFIGVEVCGAVKNVLAIATGMSDGLELGANARSALITRGLAEMSRLCEVLGGQRDTVMGLAGLGDLVLTCTAEGSRNRRFGMALGQGIEQDQAERDIGQVVEGFHNVRQIYELAQLHQIEMPITTEIFRILHEGLAPSIAVKKLLERTPKIEKY